MKLVFPKLKEWQQPVWDDLCDALGSGKRFIVKASRQKGKTFLLNLLVLNYCFKYPGTEQVIIEPISSQCRRVFSQIVDALENTNLIKSSNASDLVIKFRNGSKISFKSGESQKSVRGLTCTGLCVFDECAFLDDDVIQVALPLINVHRCPILAVSTPMFSEGWFFKQYVKESPTVKQYDWALDKYDFSEFISEEMIEEYRQEYTPQKFKTEILGEFISDSSFVFGEFKQCLVKPEDEVPVYLGIDFSAGAGSDSTVLTYMNKYRQIVKIWATNQLSPNEQIEEIARQINTTPTLMKVLVEANSIGDVYYDTIKAKLKNKMVIEKFYTSNESKKEIVEDLILAFQKKEIGIIEDSQLLKQLSYYDIQKTKTGYTYNNSNDSIHDDYVISLCLAYHCFKLGVVNIGFGFKIKKKKKKEDR